MFKTENVKGLGDLRQLCCNVTLNIRFEDPHHGFKGASETAMLSQDQNLIRMARDYFENSMCYTP